VRPAVSVIMPFVDSERFIQVAIDSVCTQTRPEWELLLIDDGSRDASPAIAEAHAARDPGRIKVLRYRDAGNHGSAAARNLGLAHATGEFVAFLDADDCYDPDKLETEIPVLRSMPDVAMLYGPTRWWYPERPRRDWVEKPGVRTDAVHKPPHLATHLMLRRQGNPPCTCAVLVRAAVASAVGGFESSLRLYEDQTLWAKVFLRYSVFVSSRATARYRQHESSASARAQRAGEYHPWRMHAAEQRFLEWLKSYVMASRVADPELLAALEWAQAPYHRHSTALMRLGPTLVRRARSRVIAAIKRVAHAAQRSRG
jgi:glycosyltransferase involved in cell wall biosynthesis